MSAAFLPGSDVLMFVCLLHLLLIYPNVASVSIDEVDFRLHCKSHSCAVIMCSIVGFNDTDNTATLRYASYERGKGGDVDFKWPAERTLAIVESNQSPAFGKIVRRGFLWIPVEAPCLHHLQFEENVVRYEENAGIPCDGQFKDSQWEFDPTPTQYQDTKADILGSEWHYDNWAVLLMEMLHYVVHGISFQWSQLKIRDIQEFNAMPNTKLPVRDFEGSLRVPQSAKFCKQYLTTDDLQWVPDAERFRKFARAVWDDLKNVREQAFQALAMDAHRRSSRELNRSSRRKSINEYPSETGRAERKVRKYSYVFILSLLQADAGKPMDISLCPEFSVENKKTKKASRNNKKKQFETSTDFSSEDRKEEDSLRTTAGGEEYISCEFPSQWYTFRQWEDMHREHLRTAIFCARSGITP